MMLTSKVMVEQAQRPLSVALVTNTLKIGGSERNMVELCRHFDRLKVNPCVYATVGGGPLADALANSGTPYRVLERKAPYSIRHAWTVAHMLARSDTQVLHCFLPTACYYATLAKNFLGAKHRIIFQCGSGNYFDRFKQRLFWRWMVRHCDAFVGNSQASADALRTLGVEDPIHIIPNGHDTDACVADRTARHTIRAELGCSKSTMVVGFVGRLIATKRVIDLVDAVAQIRRRVGDMRLVIVGDGPERAAIQDRVRSHGLVDDTKLLGERTDVGKLICTFDLLAFPSITEGLPNTLIEAALRQVPIVATDIPGVRSVLEDSSMVLFARPESPDSLSQRMLEVIHHGDQAQDRAAKAYEHVAAKFAIEATVEKTTALYNSLLRKA